MGLLTRREKPEKERRERKPGQRREGAREKRGRRAKRPERTERPERQSSALKGRRGFKYLYGIRRRWLFSSVLVVLAFVVVAVVAFAIFISTYYYSSMETSLESKAKSYSQYFTSYVTLTDYYNSAYLYIESFDERDRMELQFIGTDGEVFISAYSDKAGTSPGTPEIEEALESLETTSWRGSNPKTGEHILAVSSPLVYDDGTVIGVMRFVTSLQLVDRQVTVSLLICLGIGAAMIAIMFFSNIYFIHSIVEPVTEITSAAHRISDGSYGIQIKKKHDDEVGELTDAINNMSMRINQAEKLKTEFISSVSHELRTPLTAITGWGETLLYDESLSADNRRGLEIILGESRRLSKLVEELLEFTRMEDGRFTLNVRQIDIAQELEETIFTYREHLRRDGMELSYEPCADGLPPIPGDPERLRQVFSNLLDNAAKHGGSGRRITVSIHPDGDYVAICIRDYGHGIPP